MWERSDWQSPACSIGAFLFFLLFLVLLVLLS